jgi:hypothetical protein
MRGKRGLGQALCGLVVLAAFLPGAGCVSYCHPVHPPGTQLLEPCLAVPKCGRDHVYVFFIHGLDPLNFANLSGVRDYVQSLGFPKTYYGQLYHAWQFRQDVRRIHYEDADAHFVLVGFSYGANAVRSLANAVKDDGIVIDLLVYLGGNTLENTQEDQPENALRIVNILASGCIWNGAQMDRAENISVPDVWHFGSPTHPRTLELLARNLADVAGAVPVPAPTEPDRMPLEEEAPTPRPVTPQTTQKPSAWDFLHPVSRLRLPPEPANVPEKKPAPPDPLKIVAK